MTSPDWPQDLTHRLREQHPGLKLELHRDTGGYVILPLIVVPERSRGLGTAIMTEIINQADRHGDTLALSPTSDFGGSKKRLEKFYRRFGFVPNKGSSKNFDIQQTMIRPPSPAPAQQDQPAPAMMLDLYHRTTTEAAATIYAEQRMTTKYPTGEVWFSNRITGQGEGYGEAIVHIRIPEEMATLDDEFPDGEEHYTVQARDLRPEHFIAQASTATNTEIAALRTLQAATYGAADARQATTQPPDPRPGQRPELGPPSAGRNPSASHGPSAPGR